MFNGASVLGSNPVNGRSTKGLPVASMVKNIEDNGWTKSYTWYDDKARPVATESQNHLGGYTRTSSVLAFSGVPTSTTTYHKKGCFIRGNGDERRFFLRPSEPSGKSIPIR